MDYISLTILALAGSALSLIGGFLLLSNKKLAQKIAALSAPFAAGALIAAALVDLLPEALESQELSAQEVGLWVLAGMALFFLLERQLNWFHHHHDHKSETPTGRRLPAMLVIGDTLHNAIDGVAIAITYLADPSLGLITAFAVALHEIPQEIGDFSLLLKAGWSRRRIMVVNMLSAVATVASALLVYTIGLSAGATLPIALAITAGVLLYVASSDIVPEVHGMKTERLYKDKISMLFVLGLVVVSLAVILARQLAE